MTETGESQVKLIDEGKIAVWVGLDWADDEHVYALQMADSKPIETGTVKQKPEDLRAWINELREKSGGGWVAVAVEQSRGALLYALMDYEFVLIYPINPKSLANYRKMLYPSGGKDDPRDAALALDYLLKHRDRLRLWQPESPEVRLLRMLCEQRRKLVDLRTDLGNQLTANLKNYFPQALAWAGPLKSPTACDFLDRWANLEELQRTKPAVVRRFFKSHGARGLERVEQKLMAIPQAQALTKDQAIVTAGSMISRSLARQIRQLNESIDLFDHKIAELFKGHPDHFIFSSLPGSGPALGPRLLTLFGDDRERFDSAEQVQTMSGIAPLVERSGKTGKTSKHTVRWRRACPKFVRQSIHEFAAHSRFFCDWAKAYYDMQIEKGKEHHQAVRALAFKWLRVIYRCWRDGTAYDEALYMESLKKNRAPLLAHL